MEASPSRDGGSESGTPTKRPDKRDWEEIVDLLGIVDVKAFEGFSRPQLVQVILDLLAITSQVSGCVGDPAHFDRPNSLSRSHSLTSHARDADANPRATVQLQAEKEVQFQEAVANILSRNKANRRAELRSRRAVGDAG